MVRSLGADLAGGVCGSAAEASAMSTGRCGSDLQTTLKADHTLNPVKFSSPFRG
jgi:hypothetical protein